MEKDRLMNPPPTKIIWIYSRYYKDYHDHLNQEDMDIEFFSDFDYDNIIKRIESDNEGNHFLLILDDILQIQMQNDLDTIFTRYLPLLKKVVIFIFSF